MKRSILTTMAVLACLASWASTPPLSPEDLRVKIFASPNGSVSNTGLVATSPWPLDNALGKAGRSVLIVLLPGSYPPVRITQSGIALRSQIKWGATVVGTTGSPGVWTETNVSDVIIRGIQVTSAALDGISLKGPNSTVRDCWVHHCSADGIAAQAQAGTLLERNLIEFNGKSAGGGQGISINGTNCIVRGNVIRYNQGAGCEFYAVSPSSSAECAFYDNLLYGNGAGLRVWSPAGQTNYCFNNTILSSTNSSLAAHYGKLCVTNNILQAAGSLAPIVAGDGAIVWSDYNLVNVRTSGSGTHDIAAADAGFLKPSAGLYWLGSASPARTMANPAIIPPIDFFGASQSSVSDVGAVQYTSALAADARVLDPSSANGADYWVQLTNTILTISVQPQDQSVSAGQAAPFGVTATGSGSLTYQWTLNGLPVGSNLNSYTRSNCQLSDDGGLVRVTVTDANGSVQSRTATLSVKPTLPVYYVATNGLSSNTGLSTNSPWPLSYALSLAGPSNIISFMPGTYPTIAISRSGTTLRSMLKWGARVIGSSNRHGIWTTGDNVVSNVVVDGFEVSHSYIDGVKFNGHNSTVRNCWIHHSGRGNPSWVTNTDTSYTGQGVACHGYNGTIVEYNLIEENGAWISHDHGIYISGTNCIVRGNVLRKNLAYGVQLYNTKPADCMNIQVYRNLMYGNGRGAFIVYSWGAFTNYLFNNTIIASVNGPVQTDYGVLCMTNNIIWSTSGSQLIEEDIGPPVQRDYNVVSQPDRYPGPHDKYVSTPGFVNSANGLYWLSVTSPARGAATPSVMPPVDFFRNAESSVTDAGAFQYNSVLSSDTRVLDPSPQYPDYWVIGP